MNLVKEIFYNQITHELECGPMPNVMATLPKVMNLIEHKVELTQREPIRCRKLWIRRLMKRVGNRSD